MQKFRGRLVAIGDAHAPYIDQKCLKWVYERVRAIKPNVIVQVGDGYDAASWSSFPREITTTPREELTHARAQLEEMWSTLRRLAPKARCIFLEGNHEGRVRKRLLEKAPELVPFADLTSWTKFPGVETQ